MNEWEFSVKEVKASKPMAVPGWEPVSIATVQATVTVRIFVLLRRPLVARKIQKA